MYVLMYVCGAAIWDQQATSDKRYEMPSAQVVSPAVRVDGRKRIQKLPRYQVRYVNDDESLNDQLARGANEDRVITCLVLSTYFVDW